MDATSNGIAAQMSSRLAKVYEKVNAGSALVVPRKPPRPWLERCSTLEIEQVKNCDKIPLNRLQSKAAFEQAAGGWFTEPGSSSWPPTPSCENSGRSVADGPKLEDDDTVSAKICSWLVGILLSRRYHGDEKRQGFGRRDPSLPSFYTDPLEGRDLCSSHSICDFCRAFYRR